jgi:hypothetical protein
MRKLAMISLLACGAPWVAASAAEAHQIDPRRIASCQLAAENMRERVRPESADYARYGGDATYWSAQVERFVPDASQRVSLIEEGRRVLDQALAQREYMAGMLMVAQVLDQCNAGRSVIEGAVPNG